MGNIWFTSDTHYMHRNIAGPKVSKWESGYRDFKDEKEMSKCIVDNINKYVKEDDILYHLGDWSFGGIDNIWAFRKQVDCKNIHLVLGNHDTHIYNNRTLPNSTIKQWDGYGYVNTRCYAKEIFSSVSEVLDVQHGKSDFFLSHYSHRVWHGSHKGVIHLYGHSHDSLDKDGNYWGKSMDVGIDSAKRILGEYRPFKLEEVVDIMNKRDVYLPDHHKENTNK